MHIQREAAEKNAIRSYRDGQIQIGSMIYQKSLIVSKNTIIHDWGVSSVKELNIALIEPLLNFNPDLIIIGDQQGTMPVQMALMIHLSKHRIGLEKMSLEAACRTFNILLNEHRNVVAGLII